MGENFDASLMTGEYNNTLDDKGRIMFPAKIRSCLPEQRLIITRGLDTCLWLFTLAGWKKLSDEIMEKSSIFNGKSRLVVRRIIAPAQEVEIDKNGRISIPQSLREYAELEKDCVILGLYKYFELWSEKKYESYLQESEPDFLKAAENLSEIGL